MQVHLRVAGSAPADQTAEFARRAEEAGFHGIGVPDTQLIMRDVYIALALAAQRTSTLDLMTAVTNPMTRHVSVLASLAQTVEELAPGRLTLVVGSGYSAVNTIGKKAATLKEMRESVTSLKALLAGDSVDFGGFQARLPYAAGRRIPVLLAATGPRTIELAGEVADGALLAVGLHPGSMDAARSILHAGARKAGRDPDKLEVVYLARVHVADDLDAARDMARPICAQWALEPYRARWLREAGVDLPDLEVPPELEGLYPDIPHAENWEEARRLTSFLSDDLVTQICDVIGLVGGPDRLAARLRDLDGQGVDKLFLSTMESYAHPESTLQAFAGGVFGKLRSS
ncbi:MAG: LLM class flavin-dependent oxidoreductase [Dehalococcoidia bacterium]|nr:LLM class flavin-dependent oxidoreductase [Dehalococcoidia bacterium]